MKEKLVIYKYAYFRTPLYRWMIENNQGGSFSNSGFYRSRNQCLIAGTRDGQKTFEIIEDILVTE